MSAMDEVEELIEKYKLATAELVRGNPEPHKMLISHREGVTLANPFCPPVRGWDSVAETLERTAARLSDGEFLVVPFGNSLTLRTVMRRPRMRTRAAHARRGERGAGRDHGG